MYDEHYQILEFAWMKLGHSTLDNMAWEYNTMSRPTLQPWIAIVVFKMMGMTDPFKMALVLRLITSFLGLSSLIPLCLLGMQWIKNEFLRKLFPVLLASLPIIAFVHARFSSEGFSCIFLIIGICFLLIGATHTSNQKKTTEYLYLILTGIAFAIAFVCRIQIALIFPGIIVWATFIQKTSLKKMLIIGFVMLVIIGLCAVLDRYYYGVWVNSLWLYFKINFLEGKADSFGTLPFFQYFTFVKSNAGFVWGWLLILTIIIGWTRKPLNIFTFAFLPYFLFHCIVGHKELRFLFPMVCGIPLFIVFAFDGLQILDFKIWKTGFKISGILFLIFFIASDLIWIFDVCLSPARIEFYAYKYLDRYRDQRIALISYYEEEWPYGPNGHLNMDIYKPHDLVVKYHMPKEAELKQIADSSKIPVYLYSISNNDLAPDQLTKSGLQYQVEYKSLPDWLIRFKAWGVIKIQPIVTVYAIKK